MAATLPEESQGADAHEGAGSNAGGLRSLLVTAVHEGENNRSSPPYPRSTSSRPRRAPPLPRGEIEGESSPSSRLCMGKLQDMPLSLHLRLLPSGLRTRRGIACCLHMVCRALPTTGQDFAGHFRIVQRAPHVDFGDLPAGGAHHGFEHGQFPIGPAGQGTEDSGRWLPSSLFARFLPS